MTSKRTVGDRVWFVVRSFSPSPPWHSLHNAAISWVGPKTFRVDLDGYRCGIVTSTGEVVHGPSSRIPIDCDAYPDSAEAALVAFADTRRAKLRELERTADRYRDEIGWADLTAQKHRKESTP